MYVFCYIYVCVCVLMYEDQRITCRNWFSPFNTWSRDLRLVSRHPCLLSHLPGPGDWF